MKKGTLQELRSWSKINCLLITQYLENQVELIKLPYRKGRLALKLTCDVLDSAHASAPWLSKNSIEEVYEVWKMLSNEISSKYNKTDKKSESVSISLTEISGVRVIMLHLKNARLRLTSDTQME